MPKGIPTKGSRTLHRKWTLELLLPLHHRWLAGETLLQVAKSVGTTRGRLRWAMDHHGLRAPNHFGCRYPSAKSESTPAPRYNPTTAYADRHYKGSFDL